jgi:hypothetical protein
MLKHSHNSSLPIKKRHKLDLGAIVRGLSTRGYDTMTISAENLFELYRMLIRSAGQRQKVRGGEEEAKYPGLVGELNACTGCCGQRSFGADWQNDIPRRVLRILLGGLWGTSNTVWRRWIRENNIDSQKSIILTLPTRQVSIDKDISALFALVNESRRTRISHNKIHPIATALRSVSLGLEGDVWAVDFTFQYPNEKHGSHWSGPTIKQRPDELFADFVVRAREKLDELLTPACTHKTAPRYSSLACAVGFIGREADSKREVIGGEYVEEVAQTVAMPAAFTGDVVCFKGDRQVFWRSSESWDARDKPEMEPQEPAEDFWILLPGSRIPTRMMVHMTSKGELCYRGELPSRQEGYGLFAPSNSGTKFTEKYAREARARLLLTQSAYRRGFLAMPWREHSQRNVDEILHPTTGSPGWGRGPREKEDAIQYTKDVCSVLWQSTDICPVTTRTHCESGDEDGYSHDEALVTVGGFEPYHEGEVTENEKRLAAHAYNSDPPIPSPIPRANAVALALQQRGLHALPHCKDGFYVCLLTTHPRLEDGRPRFSDATTKVVMYDVDLPYRRNMSASTIAEEIAAIEGLHVRSANGDDDALRKLIEMQTAPNQGLGTFNG